MYDRVTLKRTKRFNDAHRWIFSNEIKTDFRNIPSGVFV